MTDLNMPKAWHLATWNVNSVRARLPHMVDWLRQHHPDVVLLQETKAQDHQFPIDVFEEEGYNVCSVGQKTYNGVAILSKSPIDEVITMLPGDPEDTQARYIQALTDGRWVISVYVPNGQTRDSPAFAYKKKFLARLGQHMACLLEDKDTPVFLGGDFNVAPSDQDVYDPVKWKDCVLCTPEERTLFQNILEIGLADCLLHQGLQTYTWWDYRAGHFQKNYGLRIDHILTSHPHELQKAYVDREIRGCPRPSDHAPVHIWWQEA